MLVIISNFQIYRFLFIPSSETEYIVKVSNHDIRIFLVLVRKSWENINQIETFKMGISKDMVRYLNHGMLYFQPSGIFRYLMRAVMRKSSKLIKPNTSGFLCASHYWIFKAIASFSFGMHKIQVTTTRFLFNRVQR